MEVCGLSENSTIYEKLLAIQAELKVPKNKYNSFGNYNYRNAESIMEAAKPLLKKNKCVLTLTDKVEQIGDRYYVVAKATVSDEKDSVYSVAYAREDETKKGMDASQITVSASSYARKYALNGLFILDDTKDADYEVVPADIEHAKVLSNLLQKQGKSVKDVEALKGLTSWDGLTMDQFKEAMKELGAE